MSKWEAGRFEDANVGFVVEGREKTVRVVGKERRVLLAVMIMGGASLCMWGALSTGISRLWDMTISHGVSVASR